MPNKKRILFLSVSAGNGHIRAANALEAWAKLRQEPIETLHLDVMDYVSKTFRKIYSDYYLKLVSKHPLLWSMIYRKTDKAKPKAQMQKLRRAIERLSVRKLHQAIANFEPDAVFCTHFLPAELLMHESRKERFKLPIWVQITDFDLHKMWVMPYISGYFVGNAEIKSRLLAHNIEDSKIHVTGIPVMPEFAGIPALERNKIAANFSINPDKKTVLLMGGGAGMGGLEDVAAELLSLKQDFQLIVLAGKNQKALKTLQKLKALHKKRLFPFGFTNQVAELMACSDIVVTKPGGLSTSESLAMGLPMILNEPIPGQEEHNADFLLEEGVALKALDVLALKLRITQLLDSPDKHELMRKRSQALSKPFAGRDALQIVLQHFEK